jgi:hypothetical protein
MLGQNCLHRLPHTRRFWPVLPIVELYFEEVAVSWATYAKEALRKGEMVTIRPRGHSMTGKVNYGDFVILAPCDPDALKVGDIVLVRVHGTDYLHLIKAVKQ